MDSRQFPSLVPAVYEAKRRKIKNYPQHVNRASECGHPCLRYLVYCRTNWQDRVLHGPELEFIFEGGRMIEEMALRELQDAGFIIIEQQRSFEWKALQLTGHLDAKVLFDLFAYPLEVKGLNHHDFIKLNTVDDFLNSKKPWIRKYPGQLMMYLLNSNAEVGCFYLKDKLTFQPKEIWVTLDYEYTEGICKRLEEVNRHVAEGTLPDPIDDYSVCERCGYSVLCLPSVLRESMQIIDDDELEDKLNRRAELAPLVKEYNELDDEIKKAITEKERLIVGDYLITGKWVDVKGYTKAVEPSRYWKTKIVRLKPEVEE